MKAYLNVVAEETPIIYYIQNNIMKTVGIQKRNETKLIIIFEQQYRRDQKRICKNKKRMYRANKGNKKGMDG